MLYLIKVQVTVKAHGPLYKKHFNLMILPDTRVKISYVFENKLLFIFNPLGYFYGILG